MDEHLHARLKHRWPSESCEDLQHRQDFVTLLVIGDKLIEVGTLLPDVAYCQVHIAI